MHAEATSALAAGTSAQPDRPARPSKSPSRIWNMVSIGALALIVVAIVAVVLVSTMVRQPQTALQPTSEPTLEPPTQAPTITPASNDVMLSQLYQNKALGVTMQYPEGWLAQESGGNAVFASSEDFFQGVLLKDIPDIALVIVARGTASDLPSEADPGSPSSILEWLIKSDNVQLTKVGKIQQTTLASSPAAVVELTYVDSVPFKQYWAIIVSEDVITTVTAITPETSWPKYSPIFDAMLASLTLQPTATLVPPTSTPLPIPTNPRKPPQVTQAPSASPTAIGVSLAEISCFIESEVSPGPGQTMQGSEVVRFNWPNRNRLPLGYAYHLNVYTTTQNNYELVASGVTKENAIDLRISPQRAGELVWYIVLVDANGNWADFDKCSFPSSLFIVNVPDGPKGVHFWYIP